MLQRSVTIEMFLFSILLLVTYNGELYIFGGYNARLDQHFNDLWQFNPGDSLWSHVDRENCLCCCFLIISLVCDECYCFLAAVTSVYPCRGNAALAVTQFLHYSCGEGHADNPLLPYCITVSVARVVGWSLLPTVCDTKNNTCDKLVIFLSLESLYAFTNFARSIVKSVEMFSSINPVM